MSAIKFEIDGQLVDPDDASWYHYAPCGCCCGVTCTVDHDGLLATEDEAFKDLYPNAALRKQQADLGFTMRLGLRSKVRELINTKCPHTPVWGVERTPVPDGHGWVIDADQTPSRRRKHIVPGDYTEGLKFSGGKQVTALCDRTTWAWDGRKGWLYQVAECTRCAKAAKQLAAELDLS
jgi:hypothetical protein